MFSMNSNTSLTSIASSARPPSIDLTSKIECQDDVIDLFLNQILEFIIEDFEFLDEFCFGDVDSRRSNQSDEISKDFKDLQPEDMMNSQVVMVDGSCVILKRSGRSSVSASNRWSSIKSPSSKPTSRLSQVSGPEIGVGQLNESIPKTDRTVLTVKIIYKNGNKYEGQAYKKIMHGKGRFQWSDGTVYEGEFRNGFPTGNGEMFFPDMSKYQGSFCEGLFNGFGTLNVINTPKLYCGEWNHGQKEGKGWLLYGPNDWYEGEWYQDLKHGQGLRQYKDGRKYQGGWFQDKRNGQGMMIWENNDGEWLEGNFHGQGEYIWKAFFNQTFTYPIHNCYKGQWVNGLRSGEGEMCIGTFTGMKFKGAWLNNFKHGKGILTWGNGRQIVAESLFNYDKISTTELTDNINIQGGFCLPSIVDFGYYVDKLLRNIPGISPATLEIIKTFEEKSIRNMIMRYLSELNDLYDEYASLAVESKLNFRPAMLRIFLWKLYKDIEIYKYGLSFKEIDEILAENPHSCVESVYDPFEPIYFWQFLLSLIGIALVTRDLNDYVNESPEGVSSLIIKEFLNEIVFKKLENQPKPNFKYKNLVPIKSVYALYQDVGEFITARDFLRQTCLRRGQKPLCYYEFFQKDTTEILDGTNTIPLNEKVKFIKYDFNAIPHSLFRSSWQNLIDFQRLKAKDILECLISVCPLIKNEDIICNMDYQLNFLEFYDVLLLLILFVIENDLVKKKEELVTLLPETELETGTKISSGSIQKKGSKKAVKKRKK